MNKEKLKEHSESLINPINVVTQFDFKLVKVDYKSEWMLDDDVIHQNLWYGFNTDIKSHYIGLQIQPKSNFPYEIWYRLHNGGKTMRELFKTELELLVFLKQSKFKK
jgi:hypothetical protein